MPATGISAKKLETTINNSGAPPGRHSPMHTKYWATKNSVATRKAIKPRAVRTAVTHSTRGDRLNHEPDFR
jgi:hypothetical protein